MEGNHEMSGGDLRIHGGEVVVPLKRGPVPPSAPSSCTIGGNHKMSSGKCPVGDYNESINEVFQKALKNCKLTYHEIQKDIMNAIVRETSKAIIKDLDNEFFSILVDESRDISVKEQMTLVLRYVNKKGIIIERVLSIVYVASTTTLSLKYAIEYLLCENNLSLFKLRGQGYDGASNMQVSRRPRRNTQRNINLHHYHVELFYTVIDMQLQELNNRFSEANIDLLLCMACLNPSNSFVASNKKKLIRLAKFYPSDFLGTDILALDFQFQNYIFDMRSNDLFLELQGVSELGSMRFIN
ncbi:uncharacterized protein LOC142628358 [Castanea sativa]|uniref:uncharacterized protein LOC142628358 n=1 Tax=Castanea sativa TaxID=21020 RepID=UPI003F652240